MIKPNRVYCAIMFFPDSEDKSIEMLTNAPNVVELDMEWISGRSKLTIKGGEIFLLHLGDILFFNPKKEFSHVLYNPRIARIPKKNL